MDTSEQYIKMCDCPEIQEQWRAFSMKSPYDLMWRDYPDNKLDNIWLPMQDQIQEMIYSPLGIYATSAMFEEIAAFGMSTWKENLPTMEKDQEITSGEQLWLAFYMWEKHEKVWDGNEWLKKQ